MDRVEVSMAEAKSETKTAAAPPQTPAPAEAPAPAPRRALAAVTALLLGLSVGAGVGIVAGGTLLAAWRSGELESKAETHGGGEQVVYVEATPAVAHTIDALVVNPADSDGLRFLMATMVVEVDAASTAEQLQRRDAEVREAVLRTLGSKTVTELASIENRDALKEELREAMLSVLDRGYIRRIHLPQFVIQ